VRRLTFALLFVVLAAAVVPAAAAEPLRANVVSASPNDLNQAGVPQTIVFTIFRPELPDPPPPTWGKPIAGVNHVEVVLRAEGQTLRFPTEDLGGGRYRTQIVFPTPGGWSVRVSYGVGAYGPADEIDLGKGGIRIDIAADRVGAQSAKTAPAADSRQPWRAILILVAAVLLPLAVLVAAGLARFGAAGRRRRMAPTS
jgi:hypothetical protein